MHPIGDGVSDRQWQAIVLIVLIGVGGFLRFHGLADRGLLGIDEGFYTDGIKSYAAIKSYAVGKILGLVDGGPVAYFEVNGGNLFLSEKPTFLFLGFLASLAIGVRDSTLLYVSALFGTLTVLLTFWLGRQLFGRPSAAFAAAFLVAVSPLHIAFSRSAYPNVVAATFAWCAVCAYVKSLAQAEPMRHGWLLTTGVLVGVTYTVHSGFFWLPVVLIASELVRVIRTEPPAPLRRHAVHFMRAGFVMALPLLLWESVFRAAKWTLALNPAWSSSLQRSSGETVFYTYFEREFLWFRPPDGLVLSDAFLEPFYYLQLLARHEAWLLIWLAAAGLLTLTSRGQRAIGAWLWVAALLVVPLTVYSLMPFGGPRHMVVVIPAMCLLACRAVETFVGSFRRAGWSSHLAGSLALVALVVVLEAGCVREVLAIRSSYRAAIDYMAAREGVKHISDRMYVARLYVGRANAIDHFFSLRTSDADMGRHHISLEKLRLARARDYRYFVRHSRQPSVIPPYDNELVMATDSGKVRPLVEMPQPVGWYWPAEICRCREDAAVPQTLQVYAVDDVIRYLDRGVTRGDEPLFDRGN